MERVTDIPLKRITTPKERIRIKNLDEKSIKELIVSIQKEGLLLPILIRSMGKERYEMVDGERRYSAFSLLGKEKIPSLIREMDDKKALAVQILANENRADYTPYERALGYKLMWKSKRYKSQREMARLLGKDISEINFCVRLFTLPKEIVNGFQKGLIDFGHIRLFFSLPDRKRRLILYHRIINQGLTRGQAREAVVTMDDEWLSGEREKLRKLISQDKNLSSLIGEKIKINNFLKRSRISFEYSDLKELKNLLKDFYKVLKKC